VAFHIALLLERFIADIADEWPFISVGPHVKLHVSPQFLIAYWTHVPLNGHAPALLIISLESGYHLANIHVVVVCDVCGRVAAAMHLHGSRVDTRRCVRMVAHRILRSAVWRRSRVRPCVAVIIHGLLRVVVHVAAALRLHLRLRRILLRLRWVVWSGSGVDLLHHCLLVVVAVIADREFVARMRRHRLVGGRRAFGMLLVRYFLVHALGAHPAYFFMIGGLRSADVFMCV